MKQAASDPEIEKEMREYGDSVKMKYEESLPEPLSMEKAKEVLLEKIELEFQSDRELSEV